MVKRSLPIRYIIADVFLVGFSFIIMYIFKKETLTITIPYLKLFILYYFTWTVSSIFNKKFDKNSYSSVYGVFSRIFLSCLYHLFFIVFVIVIMNLFAFSRIHILGACFILFLLELSLFLYYYVRSPGEIGKVSKSIYKNTIEFSISLLSMDFVIFTGSLGIGFYFIQKYLNTHLLNNKSAFILIGVWFTFGMATSKFNKKRTGSKNIWYLLDPIIKTVLFIILSISLLIFLIRLDISLKILTPVLLFYFIFDSLLYFVLYKNGFFSKKQVTENSPAYSQDLLKITDSNLKNNSVDCGTNGYSIKLKNFNIRFQKLLSCLPNFNDLSIKETKNEDLSNLNPLPDNSFDVILNISRFNDINYINRSLLKIHNKLKPGGYFLGRVDTIRADKYKFQDKYPHILQFILYPMHFFIFRIFPKLPVCKNIYSFLTKGKRHIISKAEALGRLYYCGYKVLKLEETKDGFFFLCQKVKTPSRDPNPSFGPLIKLNRIGLDGETIKIYKLRTMHPYSEYIQDYIYESQGMKKSGKFENDFRLTGWGKWFRRLWIDELPQLINWLKGDLTLVGVRALSEHYFNLYPEDLQKLRTQFKPGIIPPYYADMPDSFEEIVESERNYLEKKRENNMITDFVYFFKVFNNIIFHNARSR